MRLPAGYCASKTMPPRRTPLAAIWNVVNWPDVQWRFEQARAGELWGRQALTGTR